MLNLVNDVFVLLHDIILSELGLHCSRMTKLKNVNTLVGY